MFGKVLHPGLLFKMSSRGWSEVQKSAALQRYALTFTDCENGVKTQEK